MINQIDNYYWFKLNGILRYFLAHFATGIFPIYVVNEYPKSGGSWLSGMLSEAIGVPFPRNQLPTLGSCILHGHMMHSWNMRNVVVLWRDGRDVLVSEYYHSLFENDKGNTGLVKICRSELQFNDYENIQENLPAFMEYVYERKKHPRISWADFGSRWIHKEDCIHIKYELLRYNTTVELSKVLEALGVKLDDDRLSEICSSHSFLSQAGRNPGEENKMSFLRKGIIGDWKNHFSDEARTKFHSYAGPLLINLGYEENDDWVFNRNTNDDVTD